MALQGFLTCPLARTLYLSLDGSLHLGCPQRGWWFKVAHWQHLQLLDNKSLKGDRTARLHVPTTACIPAPEVGDEGVLWGKLLTDV